MPLQPTRIPYLSPIRSTGVAGGDEVAVDDHLGVGPVGTGVDEVGLRRDEGRQLPSLGQARLGEDPRCVADRGDRFRSEEHTYELRSRGPLVCVLLLLYT